MNNSELWPMLRRKFPESEYALMQEVSNAAGFSRTNSADFIAVNLWPSRGLSIHGIERKSGRGDWLKELKQPQKAESIAKHCDHFWLLTDYEDIAKLEEIPAAWGWITVKGSKIYTKKEAPKLSPLPVDKHFMCAMLKRACDRSGFVHKDSIREAIEEAVEKEKERSRRDVERLEEELAVMRKLHQEFYESSGIKIGRWDNPKKIGQAVKFISEVGVDGIRDNLKNLQTQTETILKTIKHNIENL